MTKIVDFGIGTKRSSIGLDWRLIMSGFGRVVDVGEIAGAVVSLSRVGGM